MLDFIQSLANLGISCRIESGNNQDKLAIKLSFYKNDNLIRVFIKEVKDSEELDEWIEKCLKDVNQ
jgi:hypothetical protein